MQIPRPIRKKQQSATIGADGWQAVAGISAVILTILAVCFYVAGVSYWDRLLGFWYKVDSGLLSLDFHELVWLGGFYSIVGVLTDIKHLVAYLLVPAIFVLLNHFVLAPPWQPRRTKPQSKFLQKFRLIELLVIEIVVLIGPILALVASVWVMIGFVQVAQNQADLALEKAKLLKKDSAGSFRKDSSNARVSEFVLTEGCALKAAILGSTRNGYAVVRLGDEFGMIINASSIKAVFEMPETGIDNPIAASKQKANVIDAKREKLPECVF